MQRSKIVGFPTPKSQHRIETKGENLENIISWIKNIEVNHSRPSNINQMANLSLIPASIKIGVFEIQVIWLHKYNHWSPPNWPLTTCIQTIGHLSTDLWSYKSQSLVRHIVLTTGQSRLSINFRRYTRLKLDTYINKRLSSNYYSFSNRIEARCTASLE